MILSVIILSILQGLTEFLPISSSAHLAIFPWLFNLPNPGLSFDAAIHIGTALALLIYFAKDFIGLIKKRDRIIWLIILASIPAAIAGFLGDKMIEQYFHTSSTAPLIIGIGLIIYGILMYVIDHRAKLQYDIGHIGVKRSLAIGFAQVLALVPGTSRSGITITAGEFLGLKREDAARFSFWLATPISLGAGLYKLMQLVREPSGDLSIWLVVLGIVISFITGIAVIVWLLNYLKKHSLLIFVAYRVVIGLTVIIIWFLRR